MLLRQSGRGGKNHGKGENKTAHDENLPMDKRQAQSKSISRMMQPMNKNRILTLVAEEKGRLDKALAACLGAKAEGLSRARLQQLIRADAVSREGGGPVSDPSAKAEKGEIYLVALPPLEPAGPKAQEVPFDVLYEDQDLLVVNKPAGLVVHPGAGNGEGTLVNGLLAYCGDRLSGIGGVARPGIVHRLDKDTSGLMVVAKNDAAHKGLSAQFADRSLSRVYRALVWGVPAPLEGEIEGAIGRHPRARRKMAVTARGGKEALTRYKVLEAFGTLASLVECRLATGRTHQIRVHMEHKGHPVVGDPLYGSRRRAAAAGEKGLVALLEAFPRQALHAGEIRFVHPASGKIMKFRAPLPVDMTGLLKKLRGFI